MPLVGSSKSGGSPSAPQTAVGESGGAPMSGTRLEGFLTKKGGVQWKRRWFTLEDHVITYLSKPGDLRARGRMVLVAESRVTNLPTRVHAFQVITNAKALMVFADSEEERERWVTALKQAIAGLKERALQRRSRRNVRVVNAAGTDFELDMKYEMIKPIGHGAYGVVISALDHETNTKVAIKKIPGAFDDLVDAKRIVREVRLLRHFNHENVIKVVDILPPASLEDFDHGIPVENYIHLWGSNCSTAPRMDISFHFMDVYIISELMETDLHRVIYSRQRLTDEHTQYFLYQILCALKYIHSASVLHRDLKPSNVLLNANCDLKLCDFGLSRGVQDDHEAGDLTEYVVTRWYRAPEIMLSVQNYNEAIDVWSVGCIFGEMLGRKPLFAGNDYIHQLRLITQLIGKPTERDLWFVKNPRARRFMLGLHDTVPANLTIKFPDANNEAIDLLSKMLVLDPEKRITVDQALQHPYLASLHDVNLEPVADTRVDWRCIEAVELTKHNLRLLIFEDVLHFHPECRGLLPQRPNSMGSSSAAGQHQARASNGSGNGVIGGNGDGDGNCNIDSKGTSNLCLGAATATGGQQSRLSGGRSGCGRSSASTPPTANTTPPPTSSATHSAVTDASVLNASSTILCGRSPGTASGNGKSKRQSSGGRRSSGGQPGRPRSTSGGAGEHEDDEEDEGVEWPPQEAAGPSAGLGATSCVGSAGWTGDGAPDDAAVLAAAAAAAAAAGSGSGADANGARNSSSDGTSDVVVAVPSRSSRTSTPRV